MKYALIPFEIANAILNNLIQQPYATVKPLCQALETCAVEEIENTTVPAVDTVLKTVPKKPSQPEKDKAT